MPALYLILTFIPVLISIPILAEVPNRIHGLILPILPILIPVPRADALRAVSASHCPIPRPVPWIQSRPLASPTPAAALGRGLMGSRGARSKLGSADSRVMLGHPGSSTHPAGTAGGSAGRAQPPGLSCLPLSAGGRDPGGCRGGGVCVQPGPARPHPPGAPPPPPCPAVPAAGALGV